MWDSMGLPFVSFQVCPGLMPAAEFGAYAKMSAPVASRAAAIAIVFIDVP